MRAVVKMRGAPAVCAGILIWQGVSLSGCMTAAEHATELPSASEQRMTLGVVQKEIRKGMSRGDVAAALGAPNIVSQDADGRETWIYDKIATEVAYSQSSVSGSIGGLLIGVGPGVGGGALGGVGGSESSGAAEQTQRTLTVVIKFRRGVVDDLSYHSSSF